MSYFMVVKGSKGKAKFIYYMLLLDLPIHFSFNGYPYRWVKPKGTYYNLVFPFGVTHLHPWALSFRW